MSQLNNNGWIPCSEKLPNKGEVVLVQYHSFVNDFNAICIAYIREDNEWKMESGRVCDHSNILAWQTLPAPYKKGE